MGQYLVFKDNNELSDFLIGGVKADPRSLKYFLNKTKTLFFYFEGIDNKFCNIIKQEMISSGGDAAVSRNVGLYKKGRSSVLLIGNHKQFNIFIEKSFFQPGIGRLGEEIRSYLHKLHICDTVFKAGNNSFPCKDKIYLMGIINITPDSFFDGNKYYNYDTAVNHARKMIKEGVDIIDIGGESTRPGAERISVREEKRRVVPLVKFIKKNYKIPVSVDTYKADTAKAVLDEGADIINDISGLKFDKKTARMAAAYKAGVVLMHIKGTPKNMQKNPEYKNLMNEIKEYFGESIKIALDNGIPFDNIILDPGIGFGKKIEHNYIILKKLEELKVFGRPLLMGLSRKLFIGKILKKDPEERLNGSVVLNTVSILNGANIVRVHDIREHREMIKLLEYYYKI